VIEDWFEWI